MRVEGGVRVEVAAGRVTSQRILERERKRERERERERRRGRPASDGVELEGEERDPKRKHRQRL